MELPNSTSFEDASQTSEGQPVSSDGTDAEQTSSDAEAVDYTGYTDVAFLAGVHRWQNKNVPGVIYTFNEDGMGELTVDNERHIYKMAWSLEGERLTFEMEDWPYINDVQYYDILTDLKTKAAERNIPLPDRLAECLKEAKKKSTSDYVVANRDGEPLSYTQFRQFWKYIVTRTAKPRIARKPVNGKEKYMLYPELGEKARNNSHMVYSLDFEVTPHMLRHTYITNLIHSSVDPKTVQYLAGHKSSKITMDIYAKVKYNTPDQLAGLLNSAFVQWNADSRSAVQ